MFCHCKYKSIKETPEMHVHPTHRHMLTYMEGMLKSWESVYQELPEKFQESHSCSFLNGKMQRESSVSRAIRLEITQFRRWLAECSDVKAKE